MLSKGYISMILFMLVHIFISNKLIDLSGFWANRFSVEYRIYMFDSCIILEYLLLVYCV